MAIRAALKGKAAHSNSLLIQRRQNNFLPNPQYAAAAAVSLRVKSSFVVVVKSFVSNSSMAKRKPYSENHPKVVEESSGNGDAFFYVDYVLLRPSTGIGLYGWCDGRTRIFPSINYLPLHCLMMIFGLPSLMVYLRGALGPELSLFQFRATVSGLISLDFGTSITVLLSRETIMKLQLRSIKVAEKCFEKLSQKERSKSGVETLVNLDDMEMRSTDSQVPNEFKNTYMVVTIFVSASRMLFIPDMPTINGCGDIKEALRVLQLVCDKRLHRLPAFVYPTTISKMNPVLAMKTPTPSISPPLHQAEATQVVVENSKETTTTAMDKLLQPLAEQFVGWLQVNPLKKFLILLLLFGISVALGVYFRGPLDIIVSYCTKNSEGLKFITEVLVGKFVFICLFLLAGVSATSKTVKKITTTTTFKQEQPPPPPSQPKDAFTQLCLPEESLLVEWYKR